MSHREGNNQILKLHGEHLELGDVIWSPLSLGSPAHPNPPQAKTIMTPMCQSYS